jgi:GTP-binding protein
VLVDTGGLERRPSDPIEAKVQEQARLAIAEADVILLVVDAAAGETPGDQEAAELLRPATVPVLVAVNKADNPKREFEGAEFHRLGWEETYVISAVHGRGVADLLDAIVWSLPPESPEELARKEREREIEENAKTFGEEALAWALEDIASEAAPDTDELEVAEGDGDEDGADGSDGSDGRARSDGERPEQAWDRQVARDRSRIKEVVDVAIVGRPNVGKSSLLNSLLGEERVIVSDIPGTTRDTIDTRVEWSGQQVRLLDTAGLRRRGRIAGGPDAERFSSLRALKAVSRADVAVLVLDSVDGLTAQDAHVAGYVVDEGKGLVIALNKWDLVEKTGTTFDEYAAAIRQEVPFLDFAPIVSISAKTGQRVSRVLEGAVEIAGERMRRVPTGELNRVLGEATFRQTPPMVKGRRPKIFYGTQAAVGPPTFVIFARDAASVHFSYQRYLENQLRAAFGFDGTPIRLLFRERSKVELEKKRGRGARAGSGGRRTAAVARPRGATRPKAGR